MRKFKKSKIIWISLVVGVFYWIVDSIMDGLFFHRDKGLLAAFFVDKPDQLWMRLFTVSVLVLLGFFIQYEIDKRRQKENELIGEEHLLADVFSSIQDGISILDKDMNIMRVNSIMEKWYEHAMPIVGRKCYQAYHCREIRCDICPTWRTLETGKTAYEIVPKTGAEGKIVGWQDLYSFPMIDTETGKLIGVIEYVRDITDRKLAENALIESEEKYRAIFEESEDVIYISTPDGRFLDINPAGIRLLGYSSKEEILNLDIDKDVYFNPSERMKFKQMIEEKSYVKDFETVLKIKSGNVAIVFITARVHRDEKGKIIFYTGIIRDVTEKKKLEAQLFYAQKMEAIGQLAGGVAHDFNNIITAIVGYASLIKMKIKQDNHLNKLVDPILISSERAKKLTQSLLALGRKQMVNLKPLELNSIIKDIEKLLLKLISEDIIFKTVLTKKDTTVLSDYMQIEQILMNLATNASDAMPDGGEIILKTDVVTIDKEFIDEHGFESKGVYVLMSFTDTGTGMDAGTKTKIFEPFFTTKEVDKGSGLGLAMVYGIVKQHKGYIEVYSEVGKGTTFNIYIPLLTNVKPSEKIDSEAATKLKRGSETILLAEDDESVRKITKSVLEEFGYTVIAAENGEEAVKKFNENGKKIKLLLLDLIMPIKGGKEAYEEIKKMKPGIKVIFTSGYTMNAIKTKSILDEKYNFIAKPILPFELVKMVNKVLEK